MVTSYLEVKTNALIVKKWHLSLICNFLRDNVETVFWKRGKKRLNLQKSNIIIESISESFLENGFEAILSWKTNVLNLWNWRFSAFSNVFVNGFDTTWRSKRKVLSLKEWHFLTFFCKFLSGKVEIILW